MRARPRNLDASRRSSECATNPSSPSLKKSKDPDVYYISKTESHIDVKGWIYEFINLSIPMQKTCEYENMDGPYCNRAARDLLNGMKAERGAQENPIWKDLKKFKDLE